MNYYINNIKREKYIINLKQGGKMKVKSENGSMTIYVSVVLLTMLLILTALFLTSNSVRESQIQTIIKIKVEA